MRRSSLHLLLLIAWLFASGSHWDLVQTFAWGKMFTRYAQGSSFTVAMQKTFDPTNWCDLCQVVNEGKQQSQASLGPKVDAKLLFLLPQPEPLVWTLPPASRGPLRLEAVAESWREPPLTPPPRLA